MDRVFFGWFGASCMHGFIWDVSFSSCSCFAFFLLKKPPNDGFVGVTVIIHTDRPIDRSTALKFEQQTRPQTNPHPSSKIEHDMQPPFCSFKEIHSSLKLMRIKSNIGHFKIEIAKQKRMHAYA